MLSGCPECHSEDIDLAPSSSGFLWECQECGERFNDDEPEPEPVCNNCGKPYNRGYHTSNGGECDPYVDDEEDDEPDIDDRTPPDFGPPGSGAVIIEYEVGTYDEPW